MITIIIMITTVIILLSFLSWMKGAAIERAYGFKSQGLRTGFQVWYQGALQLFDEPCVETDLPMPR